MKNIPTINLLTSLLMISQNVSAAYGHLNLSTGESDELFEGTNLCFAETWPNILSDTGNAPDQTSPFLHENTQQHPVDKTNEDRLGQPSSFSYDAFRPDDGNDTTQSGLFSMLGTTGSNNSLPQSHVRKSFLQPVDNPLPKSISTSFQKKETDPTNPPSFFELPRNETTVNCTQNYSESRTERHPVNEFPNPLISRTQPSLLSEKRPFSNLDYSSEPILATPFKMAKKVVDGYGHLSEDERRQIQAYIEGNPKKKSSDVSEYAKKIGIKLTPIGVSRFKSMLKRNGTTDSNTLSLPSYSSTYSPQQLHAYFPASTPPGLENQVISTNTSPAVFEDIPNKTTVNYPQNNIEPRPVVDLTESSADHPKQNNKTVSHNSSLLGKRPFSKLDNSLDPINSRPLKKAKTTENDYDHLTDSEKQILQTYIESNPGADGVAISNFANVIAIKITPAGATSFKESLKKFYRYDQLTPEHQAKISDFIRANPGVEPNEISDFIKNKLKINLISTADSQPLTNNSKDSGSNTHSPTPEQERTDEKKPIQPSPFPYESPSSDQGTYAFEPIHTKQSSFSSTPEMINSETIAPEMAAPDMIDSEMSAPEDFLQQIWEDINDPLQPQDYFSDSVPFFEPPKNKTIVNHAQNEDESRTEYNLMANVLQPFASSSGPIDSSPSQNFDVNQLLQSESTDQPLTSEQKTKIYNFKEKNQGITAKDIYNFALEELNVTLSIQQAFAFSNNSDFHSDIYSHLTPEERQIIVNFICKNSDVTGSDISEYAFNNYIDLNPSAAENFLRTYKVPSSSRSHLTDEKKQKIEEYIRNNPKAKPFHISEYEIKKLNVVFSTDAAGKLKKSLSPEPITTEQKIKIRDFSKKNPGATKQDIYNFALEELNLRLNNKQAIALSRPSGSYKHLTEEQKALIIDFITKKPNAKDKAISDFAHSQNINLNRIAAQKLARTHIRSASNYDHLTKEQKQSIEAFIRMNPNIKPAQISKYAIEELEVDLNRFAAEKFKQSLDLYALTTEQKTKICDFRNKNPDASAKDIYYHALKELYIPLSIQQAITLSSNSEKPSYSYLHLTDDEKSVLKNFIKVNTNTTGMELSNYAFNNNINLNYLAARSFLKACKASSSRYSHLTKEQQQKLKVYIDNNSSITSDQLSNYATGKLEVDLNKKAANNFLEAYRRSLASRQELTAEQQQKIEAYVKNNLGVPHSQISDYAKRELNVTLSTQQAIALSGDTEKLQNSYSHLTPKQKSKIEDFIRENQNADGDEISRFAFSQNIVLYAGGAKSFLRVKNRPSSSCAHLTKEQKVKLAEYIKNSKRNVTPTELSRYAKDVLGVDLNKEAASNFKKLAINTKK